MSIESNFFQKARKDHTCVGCYTVIQKGEKYTRSQWLDDDCSRFRSIAHHVECRETEIKLNETV
jgi:hypothetical protein